MNQKISLIIPTYLKEAERYLHLCLESIENLDYQKELMEIIVVSSGHKPEINTEKIKHFHQQERLHYAEAINKGISFASEDSRYFLLLSDDLILTKNSLKHLVQAIGNTDFILGPISNCEMDRNYTLQFHFKKDNLYHLVNKTQYRFDDLAPFKEELMNAESAYPSGVIYTKHLCFFAVLIPRSTYEKIGPLDEQFKSGQEDIDYITRAVQKGIGYGTALDSLIWHFSGVTADLSLDEEIRKINMELFKKKYPDSTLKPL